MLFLECLLLADACCYFGGFSQFTSCLQKSVLLGVLWCGETTVKSWVLEMIWGLGVEMGIRVEVGEGQREGGREVGF